VSLLQGSREGRRSRYAYEKTSPLRVDATQASPLQEEHRPAPAPQANGLIGPEAQAVAAGKIEPVHWQPKAVDMRLAAHFLRPKDGDADMDMDPNYLMLSLLFGAVGTGLFMYGKKSGKIPHLAAGLALMTCPYFITNLIAMVAVCVVLAVAPFVLPET
jgi:hypothetical protein